MTSDEIREAFLRFFEQRQHTRVPSSPLLPANDATLLFTNAGMVQFKDVFLGQEERAYRRAASSQRCLRVSGKHNDLDNVGRTARHHTFFEMLGNFSFGDYFKEDAIRFAWELITDHYRLDTSRLWVTVFRDDDDAARIWEREAGVRPDRIVRLGEKDNYWSMGDTGPQGPCSEILFDQAPDLPGTPADAVTEADGDRFLEIWNLVFMQYNKDANGVITDLPRQSIDTGSGLERVASILQGVPTNWDTDLLRPIIARVEDLSGRRYDQGDDGFPFRVIADHARTCAFLIADGILPSNEWRGYVLRRILRRAVRFGRRIGLDRPFLADVADAVMTRMAGTYPYLTGRRDFVLKVIRLEEDRFSATLATGLTLLDSLVGEATAKGETAITGADAFRLYDTYGFPLELTEEVAGESGLSVDTLGYQSALGKQRDQAKAAAKFSGADKDRYRTLGVPPVRFVGYDRLDHTGQILAILHGDESIDEALDGETYEIVVSETPAYAESGGQVGDTGTFHSETGTGDLLDTQRPIPEVIVHTVRVTSGYLAVGGAVEIRIDGDRRARIAKNHTATHLLHAALHDVLGQHATQAGSLVAPNRLRFDFAHLAPVTPDELREVARQVNGQIQQDLPVHYATQSYQDAIDSGAMALFGEKYGDVVRTVCIRRHPREELEAGTPCASLELCGGTHVGRTGEIGFFVIVSEGSVGSGIRRIEALTGSGAEEYVTSRLDAIEAVGRVLKASATDVEMRVQALQDDLASERKRREELERELARSQVSSLTDRAEEIDGVTYLGVRVNVGKPEALRDLADLLRDRLQSAVIVLAAPVGDRPHFLAAVTPDLVSRGYHAGTIIKQAATVAGGGGGGRPDLAQAGGKDTSKIDEALAAARRAVRRT